MSAYSCVVTASHVMKMVVTPFDSQ